MNASKRLLRRIRPALFAPCLACLIAGQTLAQMPADVLDESATTDGMADEAAEPSLDAALEDDLSDRLGEFEQLAFGSGRERETEVLVYACRNVQALTLRRIAEEFITSAGMVAESAESDQLVIADRKDNLELIEKILIALDQPVPQILVEARIVELNINSDFEKEVNLFYQNIGLDPLTGNLAVVEEIASKAAVPGASPQLDQGGIVNYALWSGGSNDSLNLFLRYLERTGQAKILSAPNLIIQRGKEGSIQTGQEVPILSLTTVGGAITTSTEFKNVGIKLRVKPTRISGPRVRLEVNPEVSTVIDSVQAGDVTNPIIAVRQAQTELEVLDGQLISIAGLLQSTERDTKRRVPILGQVPVLGALFRSRRTEIEQTQLIIFLTIRIVDLEAQSVFEPDDFDPVIQEQIDKMERKNLEAVEPPSVKNDVEYFFEE